MTWSIENVFRNLERITRPPRMGHDVDVSDGAEQLAEREAEEEVSEPDPYSLEELFRENHRNWAARMPTEVKSWTCIGCGEKWYDEDHDHDCPSLAQPEPPLTDDELVGVRGLLQERYEPAESVEEYMARATRVEGGYLISPAASAGPAGDSGEAVSSFPPEPASPRFGRSRSAIHDVIAGDLTWHGWAVPAICEVLAEHRFMDCSRENPRLDQQGWREHVAPLIADRIGCDPTRAIAALQSFRTTK